jgi:hypothetical protein
VIQLPLIVPGWEIDRVDNETFARPIVLKTGRRYRIRLRLRLILGDFRDPGFLRWENITIKLDEDI